MDDSILDKCFPNIDAKGKVYLADLAFRAMFQKYKNVRKSAQILEELDLIDIRPNYYLYKGSYDLDDPVKELERIGVCTVKIYDKSELKNIQAKFRSTVENFPEYLRDDGDPTLNAVGQKLIYVLGGFAALGNPASFHNPLVRKIRMDAYNILREKLFAPLSDRRFHNKETLNVEALFDRMMYRLKGMKPVAEAWHRDVMPGGSIKHDDEIFGGWVNLDSEDQYFSCIPGSHLGITQSKIPSGFAAIDKKDVKDVSKDKHLFRVPPGYCIIFPQYILHEVVANPAKYDMMRLFTGWRLTTSNDRLHGAKMKHLMRDQAVMPIPGGMMPPMYAKNHIMFYQQKPFQPIPGDKNSSTNLIEWSENTFQSETLITPKGKDYQLVKREMDSLQEYGFPLYPPYTEEEEKIYKPAPIL